MSHEYKIVISLILLNCVASWTSHIRSKIALTSRAAATLTGGALEATNTVAASKRRSLKGALASAPDVPAQLMQTLAKNNITGLMPVQTAAFGLIHAGYDAVIHAPTGSGKTLAFVLPLSALLLPMGSSALSMPRRPRLPPEVPSTPRILCLVPSRELAKQVSSENNKVSASPTDIGL